MRKIAPQEKISDATRARIEPYRCQFAATQIGLNNRAKRFNVAQGPFVMIS
jgi:hypothetical protein